MQSAQDLVHRQQKQGAYAKALCRCASELHRSSGSYSSANTAGAITPTRHCNSPLVKGVARGKGAGRAQRAGCTWGVTSSKA